MLAMSGSYPGCTYRVARHDASATPRYGSRTPCRTGRSSTTAACSSSSSAAAPRRCGCCSTTGSTDPEPTEIIDFDPDLNRWGDIWSIFVPGIGAGPALSLPGRRAVRARTRATASIRKARLIDPYAKALAGDFLPADDGIIRPPKCVVVDDEFDWQGDRHLRRSLSETVIYEMHVRGFTRAPVERRRASGHVPGRDREDSRICNRWA